MQSQTTVEENYFEKKKQYEKAFENSERVKKKTFLKVIVTNTIITLTISFLAFLFTKQSMGSDDSLYLSFSIYLGIATFIVMAFITGWIHSIVYDDDFNLTNKSILRVKEVDSAYLELLSSISDVVGEKTGYDNVPVDILDKMIENESKSAHFSKDTRDGKTVKVEFEFNDETAEVSYNEKIKDNPQLVPMHKEKIL